MVKSCIFLGLPVPTQSLTQSTQRQSWVVPNYHILNIVSTFVPHPLKSFRNAIQIVYQKTYLPRGHHNGGAHIISGAFHVITVNIKSSKCSNRTRSRYRCAAKTNNSQPKQWTRKSHKWPQYSPRFQQVILNFLP